MKNSLLYEAIIALRDLARWVRRGYAAPSPHFIKQRCLLRNSFSGATWIETGTYLGQTTKLLAKLGIPVYSIEPEPKLFLRGKKMFRRYKNVQILNGTSETLLPELLPQLSGDINFWLDGHYSSGITFKGKNETPIVDELISISLNINRFKKICVMVDDIRCFNPKLKEYSSYPSLERLIAWAARHNMDWHIEHDIFIAKRE